MKKSDSISKLIMREKGNFNFLKKCTRRIRFNKSSKIFQIFLLDRKKRMIKKECVHNESCNLTSQQRQVAQGEHQSTPSDPGYRQTD
jgi:hypothetical protein